MKEAANQGGLVGIRKSAAEAEIANINSAAMFTGVSRENRLKLIKMTASQKTNTARKGMGIELSACSNRSRRVCVTSVATCIARFLSKRCASVFGDNS